ncbi:hypothetical protein LCGC14_2260990, partial [marine sediment metagenome]
PELVERYNTQAKRKRQRRFATIIGPRKDAFAKDFADIENEVLLSKRSHTTIRRDIVLFIISAAFGGDLLTGDQIVRTVKEGEKLGLPNMEAIMGTAYAKYGKDACSMFGSESEDRSVKMRKALLDYGIRLSYKNKRIKGGDRGQVKVYWVDGEIIEQRIKDIELQSEFKKTAELSIWDGFRYTTTSLRNPSQNETPGVLPSSTPDAGESRFNLPPDIRAGLHRIRVRNDGLSVNH